MDEYLTSFINFLKERLSDKLAGVLIYGSYIKGYFDPEKSDYDVFVLFKDEVADLKEELKEKFPKVSLQLYINLDELKHKITHGGWNTWLTFIYNGEILYSTEELLDLKKELADFRPPDLKQASLEVKKSVVDKLKADTLVAHEREGYDLNKFLLPSLLRKLQILHYIKTNELVLDFNELLKKTKDSFIVNNYSWLKDIEKQVFDRKSELLNSKDNYIKVLEEADKAIEMELLNK